MLRCCKYRPIPNRRRLKRYTKPFYTSSASISGAVLVLQQIYKYSIQLVGTATDAVVCFHSIQKSISSASISVTVLVLKQIYNFIQLVWTATDAVVCFHSIQKSISSASISVAVLVLQQIYKYSIQLVKNQLTQ
ncbi:Uncharacterised protein [Sphingobacterium spiritivorum]|uniref:Uncharacterized protein n=1 Tax=Sphingobacterium spiritivorum TaxID=258 RepID=A0A380CV42_SPHSI|nr:Uncharacterised protein [Sphingobacterium spiritivorum]